LDEIVALQRGFDLAADLRTPGKIPVVGASGVLGWHDKAKVAGPGVTLGRAGAMGKATYVSQDYWPLNTTLFVTDFFGNDPLFVYYLLHGMDFTPYNSGGVQPMLNRNYIKDLRVAIPELSEQRAIAEVLGALDDKIELNELTSSTSLELADCYSQVVQQDGDPGTIVTLAQLAAEGQLEFGDGYRTKRAEHGRPGLPILRVAEVADGGIRPAFADYVSDAYRPAIGKKTSRPGDVVLTTKGTVGRVALISADQPEFVYSPQVCYFRPAEASQLSSVYLFHWMRGPEFWRQAAGMKAQTDMADYLSLGDIKSLRITLPSQTALAKFNRRCGPLHAQAAAVRNENRTLADLRDTLLPQLLSGKLRVKDAVRTVEEVV
jgi:type I restriction enzyme S subunit